MMNVVYLGFQNTFDKVQEQGRANTIWRNVKIMLITGNLTQCKMCWGKANLFLVCRLGRIPQGLVPDFQLLLLVYWCCWHCYRFIGA